MRKIKKGDAVIVLAGKDKGRESRVLSIVDGGKAALVENVNVVKRHTRGNPAQQKPGGIVEKEQPFNISKIAILNPATGKADKVKFITLEDGRKVRAFKSSGEVIDL